MSRVDGNGWLEEYRAERGEFHQPVCARFWPAGQAAPASFSHGLDHAGIERVLYKGKAADGREYVLCEPVEGVPLGRFCDERRLTFAERHRLLLQVLEVVEYAHRHLVAHGDLCPENVAVTAAGEVKVLRFGTGREANGLEAADDTVRLGRLAAGVLAGFPLEGEVPAARPGAWFRGLGVAERREIAEARSTTAGGLMRQLEGDVDAVLATAMGGRYASVDLLRGDLQHALRGEPTGVYEAGAFESVRRWCRFHVAVTTAVVLLVVAAAGSTCAFLVQTVRVNRQRTLESARMEALMGMTGALNSRLYAAAADMPQPVPVRVALLRQTRETLDTVADGARQDPALAHALAVQYASLAARSAEVGDREGALLERRRAEALGATAR